jgi:hypothetical protein
MKEIMDEELITDLEKEIKKVSDEELKYVNGTIKVSNLLCNSLGILCILSVMIWPVIFMVLYFVYQLARKSVIFDELQIAVRAEIKYRTR